MDRLATQTYADDVTLMQRVALRDPAALRTLYERHAGLVLSICMRIVRDRDESEQLLIDIFAEAWERFDRFDPTRGSPVTYLATLSRSRAIDRVRSRKSASAQPLETITTAIDASDNSPGPVEQTLTVERRAIVRRAITALDPTQREAVELAFYDGLSHSEIADKLKKPLGTVKTHIRQGLIRLRDLLRNQWEGARG